MLPFYQTDEQNKSELLTQNHHDFDLFATAIRNDDYTTVEVTPPVHVGEPVPYNHSSWDGYNNGQAVIHYGTGRDERWSVIHIEVSRFGRSTAYGASERVAIPLGDLYGRFHLPMTGIVYLQIPERIAAIVRDLMASGQRRYEDAAEMRIIREMDQREAEMAYEAERDPEGAFGGRGNNMRF